MLSYALAIAVGLSSLILFSTAFLMSDIHRQDDFLWSGVGLFYALVLWLCATRITGGLLLGQTAAVALLISYNWQTLKLRKAIANPEKAEEINNFSILAAINGLFTRSKLQPQPTITETPVKSKVTEEKITIPETPTTDIESESTVETVETQETPVATVKTPETQETPAETSTPEAVETPADKVTKKPGFLGKFFGKKPQKSPSDGSQTDTASITNTKLDDIFDDKFKDTEAEQPQPSSATVPSPTVEIKSTTTDSVTETVAVEESVTISEDKTTESDSPQITTEVETDKDTAAETITPVTETVTEEEATTISEDKFTGVETPQAKANASTPQSTENPETTVIRPVEILDNNEIKTTEVSESKESETNSEEKPKDS